MEEMSIAGIRGYVRYIVFDNSHNLIAISFVTSSRQIARAIGSNIKRDMPVMFAKNDSALTRGGDYDVRYSKINMGYSYCYEGVAFSKLIGNGILFSRKEELYEKFYDAIMYNYDLPLLKQWMPDIYKHLKKDGSISAIRQIFVGTDADEQICGIGTASDIVIIDYRALTEEKLEAVVSELLKNKSISFTDKPQKKLNVETLDDYISEYGSDIVSNLHQKAKPNIEVEGTWKYSVSKSRRLFAAQSDCVNGIVNVLEHGRYCIVNEGMGCGKTLQSMMALDGYMNKKYMKAHPGTTLEDIYKHPEWVRYRCIVMAPANLVEKWKEEISSQIVGSNVVILNHMSQLVELKKSGRKPTGRNFYVIGKDFGKLSYVKKPIPRKMKTRELFMSVCAECGTEKQGSGKQPCICCGSKRYKLITPKTGKRMEHGLVCPECGELLLNANRVVQNWDPAAENPVMPLTPADFATHTYANDKCWYCGCKLWAPLVQNLGETEHEEHWYRVKRFKNATRREMTSIWVLKGFEEDYILHKGGPGCRSLDELVPSKMVANRKTSPLEYIKKQLKGYFDFAILDEVHQYKGGGSAQGVAAGWLINASKKTLALTGTISGGKAEDLFYLFFRLDPARMIKNGFDYQSGPSLFTEQYGCIETAYQISKDEDSDTFNVSTRGKAVSTPKAKPGISPIVFTRFLLDTATFLDLKDMADQLPPLNEYVIGVDLEEDIYAAYKSVLDKFNEETKIEGHGQKLLSTKLQFALSYTDKPYGRSDILSPLTGNVIISPPNLTKYQTELTNKEKALVRIVKKELSENRRMFIYAEYTGKPESCITERLAAILEKEIPELVGRISILQSGSPSATKRMQWIKEQAALGKQVIITNPKLCECGLDFIFEYNGITYNYNTIIQFQMGYDLFTLWQSVSRHYRLIQTEECRTYYVYSRGTIQLDVLECMAKKRNAVSVLQGGGFSSEGLSAMANGVDTEAALAKALQRGIDAGKEEAVRALYDNSNKIKKKYSKDLISHPLYHELIGVEPELEKETGVEDLFDLFALWEKPSEDNKQPEKLEKQTGKATVEKKATRTVKKKPENQETSLFDLFGEAPRKCVVTKSVNKKTIAGQMLLF